MPTTKPLPTALAEATGDETVGRCVSKQGLQQFAPVVPKKFDPSGGLIRRRIEGAEDVTPHADTTT